jgi:hypothetical protein
LTGVKGPGHPHVFEKDQDIHTFLMRQASVEGAKYDEDVLGAGDIRGADAIVEILVRFDPTDAYPELIAAAKRAAIADAAEAPAEQARKGVNPK